MSVEGGQPIRGYRPGRYGAVEEESEEADLVRLANIEVYARRATAGLPIFEDPNKTPTSAIPGKQVG